MAHLIGDFLFQFDKVHALKVKGPKGLLFHIGIVVGCLLFFVAPFLHRLDVWLFIIFIGVTHYIQDWTKIKFTSRSKHQLFYFCLDQVLHIAFISVIFWTTLRTIDPPLASDDYIFIGLYNNNIIILYFITALVASYVGHYAILLFRLDYLKTKSANRIFEKWYGCIERICIVSVLFLGTLWPLWIPVILAFRPLVYKVMRNKLNLSEQFSSKTEMILSGSFGITIGLIFYILI